MKEVLIMKVEKAIEIIKKLLATANDKGASENEAMMAALKAQELMAKYDIDVTDVDGDSSSDEIVENIVEVGNGNKWKFQIAHIVATNFCCKVYCMGTSKIIFYGYKKHADIAREVFTYLFNTGNKLADRCYAEYYNNGKNTKGVKNMFLVGYCHGIKSVLEKQCVALAIVTPKEVVDSYNEKTQGMKSKSASLKVSNDAEAFEKGRKEGKNVANSRAIEG